MNDENPTEGITIDEAQAHGSESDRCPKCGAQGEYDGSEFGDSCIYQDAKCPNGHEWREISTVTHIVALEPASHEEVGETQRVTR